MIEKRFWDLHPGLFFSFSLLCGQCILHQPLFILFPCCFFYCYRSHAHKILLFMFILVLGIVSATKTSQPSISLTEKGIGYLRVEDVKKTVSSFHRGYLIYATLVQFKGNYHTYYDLPITVFSPSKKVIEKICRNYIVQGELSQNREHRYVFRSKPDSWKPLSPIRNTVQWRYQCKEKISILLKKHCTKRTFALLVALLTGQNEDYCLPILMNRLGLGHLFAISGLHFSVLLGFIGILLTPVLRHCSYLLIIPSCFYATYLGAGASILRAFVSSLFVLVGGSLHRRVSPLNTLGWALFGLSLFCPQLKNSAGFTLSFLAAFSLITFYPLCEGLLSTVLPSRCLSCFQHMSLWEETIYLILSVFKKSLAANLSVTLGTLPLVLYYWHTFPLLSLVYNTFFPTLVMISLIGALCALATYAVSPVLAQPLFSLMNYYTDSILQCIYYYPREWFFSLYCRHCSWQISFLSIFSLLYIACYFEGKKHEKTRDFLDQKISI